MNKLMLITLVFSLVVLAIPMAKGQSSIYTSYTDVFKAWGPIIAIAILLSMFIAAIYYMIGVFLHNSTIKSNAVNEFGQAIGVAIMVVIILVLLGALTPLFTNMFSTSTASNTCNTLTGSYLGITHNYLATNALNKTMTTEVCALAGNVISGTTDPTLMLDYGLASSYLVTANLTNQSASNLNGFYMFESYIGFLKSFTVSDGFCMPFFCFASGAISRSTNVLIQFTPFQGYEMLSIMSVPLEAQANLIFEFYVLQLLLIAVAIYSWPYLLAIGIVLRATYFGRRAGGLIMGAALSLLVILPLVILLEYSAFSGSVGTPIGANSLPVLTINEKDPNTGAITTYASNTLNMYVLPKTAWIANYYGCYPNGNGNLGWGEAGFASWYLIPFYGIAYFIYSAFTGFVGSLPPMPPGNTCTPQNAISAIFDMMNAYGVMSITGFIIPLMNILIFISGLRALSALFGGDTNLIGIGKLV